MNKLITSPIDSLDGISVVTEKPMNNPIMLNTIRPAVMRQYYGLSRGKDTNGCIKRATYGYCNGLNSLGTDPAKYITKPFDSDMIGMSLYLQAYLKLNVDAFNFNDLDLSRIFNSCTVLIYNCGDDLKKDANMGWHTDVKYNNSGNFIKNINSQVENTPTVIVSLGDERLLNWRRRVKVKNDKGNWVWQIDSSWSGTMSMTRKSIVVLHPLDEKPHKMGDGQTIINYQHGNVKVTGDKCSMVLVYRVVNEYCWYALVNNYMINCNLKNEKNYNRNVMARASLYFKFNNAKYHNLVVEQFKKVMGI